MALKLVAFLVVVASVAAPAPATAMANFNQSNNVNMSSYYYGWGTRPGANCSQNSREIIVGGDSHWQFGFDYSSWAFKNGPFYVNDTIGTYDDMSSHILVFVFLEPIFVFLTVLVIGYSIFKITMTFPAVTTKHGLTFRLLSAVFKYDPPSENNTHPHSVYLFSDFWSFRQCNLKRARMLANWSDGAGEGFKFVLARTSTWQPYYFACGESNGFHCTNGNMKFFVVPRMRWWGN